MPEAEIRKALKSDLKDVEYICRMTAGPLSRENELVGKIIAKIYSTYYIEEECGNCFVLASGEKAVGYILSSLDAGVFKKVYRKKYVPQIFSLSKKDGVLAWLLPIPYMFFKKNYPAHMHIDILPGFQGSGNGTKLVETLLSELKSRGIRGVCLCVGSDNARAIAFYKKRGFKILLKTPGGIYMGQKL